MAVTIDHPLEGELLAAVMKKVAEVINLTMLGVFARTLWKTRAGGILLEVDGTEKATLLEEQIGGSGWGNGQSSAADPEDPDLATGCPGLGGGGRRETRPHAGRSTRWWRRWQHHRQEERRGAWRLSGLDGPTPSDWWGPMWLWWGGCCVG